MTNSGKRVMCAMSGGVDSSVAAKLLTEAGFDVLGVTMRLFDADVDADVNAVDPSSESTCCSLDDVEDARSVAARLGIPHRVLNYSATFSTCVVDRFCRAYLEGKTPNPCIDCNRFLKFDALQRRRRELGFDFVATGHYARRRFDEATGRFQLLKGLDPSKDQSYVLYHLTQDFLAHMLFPVGELTKPEVREAARETGLRTADKEESQDICFVPDGDYASFIERRQGHVLEPGPIVDEAGALLGEHRGLARYTIGQRKGLGVAVGEPLFVLEKDVDRNALVVGRQSSLGVCVVEADDVNLISVERLDAPLSVEAKVNYRAKPRPAVAVMEGDRLIVTFEEPVRAVAPGQALVLYQGDVVVGGGTICAGR